MAGMAKTAREGSAQAAAKGGKKIPREARQRARALTDEIRRHERLYFGEARPEITDAPGELAYGAQFSIATPNASAVAQVNLVKLGSMTHAFNQSQRFIRLSFSAAADKSLTAVAPANGNIAQPGHYMLFLIGSNGAPSVARIVHIQ